MSDEVGVITTALHMRGSVIPRVLALPIPYIMTCINVGVMVSIKLDLFDPVKYHIELHPHASAMLSSLMTFFLVFYNGHVFNRYNRLHYLSKHLSELTIEAASMIIRSMPVRSISHHMVQMLLATSFLFYFEITPDDSPGSISRVSRAEWSMLQELNLLKATEVQTLHNHAALAPVDGFATFMIFHWILKLGEKNSASPQRFNELEKKLNTLRQSQSEVLGLLELPVPFEYFHLLNFMLLVNILFLAYSSGTLDSYLACAIFFVVQLVFFGVRELSVALADPFGIDEVDFPVSRWMTSVYNRCVSIMSDDWDVCSRETMPHPMPLEPTNHVVEFLQNDLQYPSPDNIEMQGGSSPWRGISARQAAVVRSAPAGGNYQPLPTKEDLV